MKLAGEILSPIKSWFACFIKRRYDHGKQEHSHKNSGGCGDYSCLAPHLALILFSAIFFIAERVFRFDYLMPAELGLFAFGGGIILLVAAIRARSQVKLIGWEWMLMLGILAAYTVSIVVVGVGGILMLRELFRRIT